MTDERLSALTPEQACALAMKLKLDRFSEPEEPLSSPTPRWAIKRALWHEDSER